MGKTPRRYKISLGVVPNFPRVVYAAYLGKRADKLDDAPEACILDFDQQIK